MINTNYSPTPILTTNEVDDITLQDTIQLSLAEQKSCEELKSKQNEDKVKEHLIAEEIEKLVEGTKNVEENVKVEITAAEQPVNVTEYEEELVEDDYELRRREKGKHVEESRNIPSPTIIRSSRIHSTLISLDTEKLQELMKTNPKPSSLTPSSSSLKSRLSTTQQLLSLKKFHVLAQHLQEVMEESLPKMMYARVQELTKTQVPIYAAHGLIMERQQNQADVAKMIADAIQQEHENHRVEICSGNSEKRQKTTEHETYVVGESSSGQVNESEPCPSTLHQAVIWERVHNIYLGVESYQQKVNLIAPTVTFPGTEKYKMFSIVSGPVYSIVYKNSKKQKRVMRHQEVHKFCDAKLKRELEGLKSYNNNLKHGYVTTSLSKEDD
uniref:Uncharacterized protein n=1 Tax=Tanacetum cinerariifolium TaxID=118510 RepID=A0A6L2K681_TANCI|nr:hypothetical protein [Tanacetum cinerariifolium]